MSSFSRSAKLDISEAYRAKWFFLYCIVFAGIMAVLLLSGVTESRVLGFTGISRVVMTFVQLCMLIVPLFVLVSTVRSVAGDREAGVYEYLLSFPVGLKSWYFGKIFGKFLVLTTPVILALIGAALWALMKGLSLPWWQLGISIVLLISLTWCFIGIGMLLSTYIRSADLAQGAAFALWLVLLLFLDLILIGLLISNQFSVEGIVLIAILNPLQTFRTGTMLLFDPQLMLLGPTANVIFDWFGSSYLFIAIFYPFGLGMLAILVGYRKFINSDLI